MITRLETCPSCGHVFAPLLAAVVPEPAAPAAAAAPPPPPPSHVPPVPPHPAPPPPPPARRGLSAASVPKILLGLGATCLLVAAVIFLAVAWSWLGVGGRTAVLVGLTVVSALAGQLLARRELGIGAEALTTVSLGLVVLDLVGARHAGWLGTSDDERFLSVVGAALLVASLALCLPSRRLFTPQLAAPLGLGLGAIGVGTDTEHLQVVATIAVLCFIALAVGGRSLGFVVLPWTAGAGALVSFAAQTGLAATEAWEHLTFRALWVEGHGLGMVVVACLVLLPWAVVRGHDDLRQLVCALAASTLTWTVALPVFDEGVTAITLTAALAVMVWAVVAAAAPPQWYAVPRVPLAGCLLVLVPVPGALAVQALTNLFTVAEPFTAGASVRLDPATPYAHPLLLPLAIAVVVLAAALTVPRSTRSVRVSGAAVVATGLLTAALYPLPLWLFVTVLGPLGLALALPSAVLTLLVLGEIVAVAGLLLVRRVRAVEPAARLVLPVALAAFLWTGGHLLDATYDARSLTTLVALGVLAIAVPRVELEIAAAATVLISSLAGVEAAADPSVSLAIHLTLAGAAVTATALLHRDHLPLAWPGGLLLAGATWVRLYDVGVQAPEAYTLPVAVALVLVGVHRLQRDFDADTVTALLPGLALATVPSLLWALADPVSARAALLGLGCLVLLLGGTAIRWSAPVAVGWVVGGVLVLRELAPYAAQWPQWVLIGAAGTVLLGAGITWEARVRDLRQAATYLGRLR